MKSSTRNGHLTRQHSNMLMYKPKMLNLIFLFMVQMRNFQRREKLLILNSILSNLFNFAAKKTPIQMCIGLMILH